MAKQSVIIVGEDNNFNLVTTDKLEHIVLEQDRVCNKCDHTIDIWAIGYWDSNSRIQEVKTNIMTKEVIIAKFDKNRRTIFYVSRLNEWEVSQEDTVTDITLTENIDDAKRFDDKKTAERFMRKEYTKSRMPRGIYIIEELFIVE